MTKIIVTPINKSLSSKSAIDYKEQLDRLQRGEQMMWDDTPTNKAQIGDYFGFVSNFSNINWHKVTEIHPPTDRLPSWSSNVGQTTRQVLYVSPLIRSMEWSEWISLGGASKIQGTTHVKRNKDQIFASI